MSFSPAITSNSRGLSREGSVVRPHLWPPAPGTPWQWPPDREKEWCGLARSRRRAAQRSRARMAAPRAPVSKGAPMVVMGRCNTAFEGFGHAGDQGDPAGEIDRLVEVASGHGGHAAGDRGLDARDDIRRGHARGEQAHNLGFGEDHAHAADGRGMRLVWARAPILSRGILSLCATISRNRPVPAAQRSFMAKSRTAPWASMRMSLLSWPPISITVRASGASCRTPRRAGDLGDGGIGEAQQVPAIPRGDRSRDRRARQPGLVQRGAQQIQGQLLLGDALVAGMGGHDALLLVVPKDQFEGARTRVDAGGNHSLRARTVSTRASRRERRLGSKGSDTGGTSISSTGMSSFCCATTPIIRLRTRSGWRREFSRSRSPRLHSVGVRADALSRSPRDPTIGSARAHAREGLERARSLGDPIPRVAKQVLGSAEAPAAVLEQVHGPEIRHRVHPEIRAAPCWIGPPRCRTLSWITSSRSFNTAMVSSRSEQKWMASISR